MDESFSYPVMGLIVPLGEMLIVVPYLVCAVCPANCIPDKGHPPPPINTHESLRNWQKRIPGQGWSIGSVFLFFPFVEGVIRTSVSLFQ
jgi:hypothetical protein